jgi:hypothetical protein
VFTGNIDICIHCTISYLKTTLAWYFTRTRKVSLLRSYLLPTCNKAPIRAVIAQSVWRWITGWTIGILGFDSRRGLRIFLFTTVSRTALGPTQPPIQRVPGTVSLGVKRPGREADHTPPSSAEVKNAWSYTSTPQYVFMAWCLVKHKDNFNFYLYKAPIKNAVRSKLHRYQHHFQIFLSGIGKQQLLILMQISVTMVTFEYIKYMS